MLIHSAMFKFNFPIGRQCHYSRLSSKTLIYDIVFSVDIFFTRDNSISIFSPI